jgi:hypothetical protein
MAGGRKGEKGEWKMKKVDQWKMKKVDQWKRKKK